MIILDLFFWRFFLLFYSIFASKLATNKTRENVTIPELASLHGLAPKIAIKHGKKRQKDKNGTYFALPHPCPRNAWFRNAHLRNLELGAPLLQTPLRLPPPQPLSVWHGRQCLTIRTTYSVGIQKFQMAIQRGNWAWM